MHVDFFGHQGIQHRLHVGHQMVIAKQVGDNVTDRPTDIVRDQVDDPRCGWGETQNTQVEVDEDRTDAGTGQQVVHVVVGLRQLENLGL
ncbi:hypothetical protein D3C71_1852620 [compost metagenome]